MPELSRFYGIVIKMMFNDNDKHHKPHVAVREIPFDKIKPLE